MSIGERIRAARIRAGIDVPEAARRAGVDRSYWWRLENGERKDIGAEALRKVAAALDCPVAELLGEDIPAPLSEEDKITLGFARALPHRLLGKWWAEAGRIAAEEQEVAEDFAAAMT